MFELSLFIFIGFIYKLVLRKKRRPKIIIVGHAQHGKDTVAELLLKKTGISFNSSSWICLEEFIYEQLKDKYNYKSKEECFNDRVNKRTEWFNLIAAYNYPDGTRLSRLILSYNDVYVGLRNRLELLAVKDKSISPLSLAGLYSTLLQFLLTNIEPFTYGIVDIVVWVDASKRKPLEPKESMSIEITDSQYIIDNNSDKNNLDVEVDRFIDWYQSKGFN